MTRNTRRRFLADVGSGMLVGALGSGLALDLGITPVRAAQDDLSRLKFGEMEPLVALMQETPLPKLQRVLVDKLRAGTSLQTLVRAGLLANARTFGGNDYVGYHTFMALAPALDMAQRLPSDRSALPVLKVLYRNTERIQQFGGPRREMLRPVSHKKYSGPVTAEALQEATRKADGRRAEQILAAMAGEPVGEMFNHVQYAVQDSVNVHRVVLAWRAWLAVDFVGEEFAHSLLRQSVRFCVDSSQRRISQNRPDPELWTLVPRLLDENKLAGKKPGTRKADDEWIDEMAWTIFSSQPNQAADAAARALGEGMHPDAIAEAMSVAANMLLLHDPGRSRASKGDKVKGSVHGDSVGVHACDAANAWRNIAQVSNQRNRFASIIVGAYHTAGRMRQVRREPWPLNRDAVQKIDDPKRLLATASAAVKDRDQALAGAAIEKYGTLGGDPAGAFDLLLGFATSEDGALHAEKYFRTVTEEFAATRPSLRWRQLVGLARVSASEYGNRSPGYDEACDLLNVKA